MQVSPLKQAVSQFEDTKALGPGNTFVMTIRQGSFMRPPLGNQKGEYHTHCHLLDHMLNDGMMGSLLITAAGDSADLPKGTIPMMVMVTPGSTPRGRCRRMGSVATSGSYNMREGGRGFASPQRRARDAELLFRLPQDPGTV